MKRLSMLSLLGVLATLPAFARAAMPAPLTQPRTYYLPGADRAGLVTVTKTGEASRDVTVLTEAVAIKETGPKETVARFGEVYSFSPAFIAVRRDQPTRLTFWNLQPDDSHDFALVAPDLNILMYVRLPPLKKTSYVFTFHREGVFDFLCLRHQPAMSGQILVLPASGPAVP
jgi:plastocyanin